MSERFQAGSVPVAWLRENVAGRVLEPADAGFDEACAVFMGGMDQRPAVIVQPADAHDVAKGVVAARETGVPLAVKSGGHSPFALPDGGILIHVTSLRDLEIDTETRTVWAGSGLTTGEVTAAVHEHGLVLGFGDTDTVGIGGITLGGGIGYLARKYGLTIDHLLAAEIVTADGEIRVVDEESDPELFWAIRGAGANFGVVTRFRFRLQELSTVYAGLLVLPATPETITEYCELSLAAPDELTSIGNIFLGIPAPFIPEDKVGTPVLMVMMVYAGEGEVAERALAPFRGITTPLADMIAQVPYPAIFPNKGINGDHIAADSNFYLDEIAIADAKLLLEQIEQSTADMAAVQIRPLGGATARVPQDATAYAHRDRNFMVHLAAFYSDLSTADEHHRWATDLTVTLQKGVPGVYVNFLRGDSAARIREAYPPATWERLRAAKRTYDPGNLFRLNSNIPPSDG
ncbi:FAD-binding oxidoreductase [Actinophytocola algeriensis]|uniref:FAD/FMN-containing dehydrogenase n=1 Tax=Actinophytocola algeriensis TaxID=1768010 RepID=A0A7W7VBW7_9PSEU|nr:FAD-binding oxidoreductase [Actinophytocola algeriensis]MBB4904558.1 FAD/FMN-containing dehydrogenase [Actinophytocola algeriensis]MBE1476583.1 FAD/FMN-containing dehydrogenase [Actinophytocola algeriensis]